MVQQMITAAEFSAKYRSKKEVFVFLTVDCRAYIFDASNVTIYFLKDLCSGKKKCKRPINNNTTCADITYDEVKYLFCP